MQSPNFEAIDLSSSCLSDLSVFFEESSLAQIGKELRFSERTTSRLTAWMFLLLNTCVIENSKETSLNDMAAWLNVNFNIRISKQSLDERFNTYAVKLMKKCFEMVFEKVLNADIKAKKVNCGFTRVILRDATSFQLPAYFAAFYEGNGGDTSGSVLKIQQEYDLLNGKTLRLDFRNGKENDTEWLNQKGLAIAKDDLQIADLGYYKLEHLAAIDEEGGYFVSRYKVGTSIFIQQEHGKFQELAWEALLSDSAQVGVEQKAIERTVWLGAGKKKLKVRLSLQAMPKEIKEKRIKKYQTKDSNQSTKKYPYQSSDERKTLAGYNIFITNAKKEQIDTEQIYALYRLRWQIELLFKIWKSVFELDKIGKMSIYRFECLLYGKLIAILISGHIQTIFNEYLSDKEAFELSEWKSYKQLKKT
jgi:hypothetical protein